MTVRTCQAAMGAKRKTCFQQGGLVARERKKHRRVRELEETVFRLRRALRQERRRIEEMCNENWNRWQFLHLGSPLTSISRIVQDANNGGWSWRLFETFCPCCKRPLDVTVLRGDEQSCKWPKWLSRRAPSNAGKLPLCDGALESGPSTSLVADRFAVVVVMWGADPGFTLGALVLASRLRELGTKADLLLMHTAELPLSEREVLKSFWQLRQVERIKGAEGLFFEKEQRFNGVFTKIHAWSAVGYSKVLMLDIDIIPLHSLDPLFDLQPPAAFHRCRDEFLHGDKLDGRGFFMGAEDNAEWAWCQGLGINSGVLLLEPSLDVHQQMLHEVSCNIHPERVPGAGPEQDYLSRFFASAPWRHMDVAYNFQPHRITFSLERCLEKRNWLAPWTEDCGESRPMMACPLDEVRNVHFSGERKLWERCLAAPGSALSKMNDVEFAEFICRGNVEGYERWFKLSAPAHEYAEFGCKLLADGRLVFLRDGRDATYLVGPAVARIRNIFQSAVAVFRECSDRLFERTPGLLEELRTSHSRLQHLAPPWPIQ